MRYHPNSALRLPSLHTQPYAFTITGEPVFPTADIFLFRSPSQDHSLRLRCRGHTSPQLSLSFILQLLFLLIGFYIIYLYHIILFLSRCFYINFLPLLFSVPSANTLFINAPVKIILFIIKSHSIKTIKAPIEPYIAE